MTLKTHLDAPMIVVSNRLPFILNRNEKGELERMQCAGGLVTAVAPVCIECKGIWVGWPGLILEDNEVIPSVSIGNRLDIDQTSPAAALLSSQIEPVAISPLIFDSYYNGCCNGTFWPLFHSMPDRAIFSSETYDAYKKVNQVFAEKTIKALKKTLAKLDADNQTDVTPLIWIHDYQLMLSASMVRKMAEEEGLRFKLSFFMHIPFPAWDLMRLFPWDDEILEGILGSDHIGFHIPDYVINFLDCCQRRLGCRVDKGRFLCELDGRTIKVQANPIGIPYSHFAEMSRVAPKVLRDKEEQIILGIDRLDYTKGLIQRIKAFERLLEKHPEYLEKCVFFQVAVPSRVDVKEYQSLKEEIDQLIGKINGRFSKPNWSPIRYIYGCISQEQLSAFYRDASVAIVTPLRDGMNLVAKEFVACQNLSDPGVLLLSPFAGAGGMMQEAIIVNPYEIDDLVACLHRALQMPFDERLLRMKQLQRREQKMDVNNWLSMFLSEIGLLSNNDNSSNNQMAPLSMDDFDFYLSDYIDLDEKQSKLSLILDYDGTLAPIAQKPDLARMPDETINVLKRLVRYNDLNICIISGRSLTDLCDSIDIRGITYAALDGLEILSPDGTKYVHPITSEHEKRISHLLQTLQNEVCKEGAWVENKGAVLTFHYREVPKILRDTFIRRATEIFTAHGFQPHKCPMGLEAKPEVKWDRGRAAIHILRKQYEKKYGVDWVDRVKVIYCGDDANDEIAIQTLSGIACTFKVSSTGKTHEQSTRTLANYRLRSSEEVLLMLKWIERMLAMRRTPSPNSPKSNRPNSMSFSFDDSDDEMRRIRTNSRGRTQNIFRRPKKLENPSSEAGTDSDGGRKSGGTSPSGQESLTRQFSPSLSSALADFNRYI